MSLDTGSRWQDKLRPEITLKIRKVAKLNNQNAVFFTQLSPSNDKNSLLRMHKGSFYFEEQFKDCFERVPSKKAKTWKAKTPAKGSEAAEVEAEAALTKRYVNAFWSLPEDKRGEILNAWSSLPKDKRGEDPRGKAPPLRAARCSPRGTPGPGKPPLRAARCSPRGPPGKPPLRAARKEKSVRTCIVPPPGKPALMAARCSPRGPPSAVEPAVATVGEKRKVSETEPKEPSKKKPKKSTSITPNNYRAVLKPNDVVEYSFGTYPEYSGLGVLISTGEGGTLVLSQRNITTNEWSYNNFRLVPATNEDADGPDGVTLIDCIWLSVDRKWKKICEEYEPSKKKPAKTVALDDQGRGPYPTDGKLEKGINCFEADDGTLFLDLKPDDMVMVLDARERYELNGVPLPYYCQWKNTNDDEKQLIRHVMAKKSSYKIYRDHDIFPLNTNDERTDAIDDAAENIPNERWSKKLPTTPIKYLFTIVQE